MRCTVKDDIILDFRHVTCELVILVEINYCMFLYFSKQNASKRNFWSIFLTLVPLYEVIPDAVLDAVLKS